jgi:hypothetical protein
MTPLFFQRLRHNFILKARKKTRVITIIILAELSRCVERFLLLKVGTDVRSIPRHPNIEDC